MAKNLASFCEGRNATGASKKARSIEFSIYTSRSLSTNESYRTVKYGLTHLSQFHPKFCV